MKTNESYTLQERVETLLLNLSLGCSLYTTPKGRKAYAHSLLVEIQNVILFLNDAIDVIQSNKEFFPIDPVFLTNFIPLRKKIKEWVSQHRNESYLSEKHYKALKKLQNLLVEADSRLNNPDLAQMMACYQTAWDAFITQKWPNMLHETEVHTLVGMPTRLDSRRRILNHALESTTHALLEHPVTRALKADDILPDDISVDGELIPQVIAPTLYKHRRELREKTRLYEFFRLFMTHQLFHNELDKLSVHKTDNIKEQLEKWWLDLTDKVHEDVRPEYRDRFHDLALSLCRQPDLNAAFLKPTLQGLFNVKLAYNLFGIMLSKNVFTFRAVATLRKTFTDKNVDNYFSIGGYSKYGEYTSALSAALEATATGIIVEWKKG